MNIEIEGKIINIMPEQTGEGKFGKWVKQEFIIETFEKYPKKVCFSTWGDNTDKLKQIKEGESVVVSFNPESREYNDRWYTDLRAWKIVKSKNFKKEDEAPPFTENDIPPPDEEDIPF